MLSQKLITPLMSNANNLSQLSQRSVAVGISRSQQQVLEQICTSKDNARTDEEWLNAQDYETMPGPTKFQLVKQFLPGGKLYKANLIEMNQRLREQYGDIYRLKGFNNNFDTVFTYNPNDFEITYRNEGIWPLRVGLESLTYYRKKKRPDLFHGIGGLVAEQGKDWADIRNKVNPILMKVQNIRRNMPEIDEIATEFITRMEKLRHRDQLTPEFFDYLKMWSFESMCCIALNTRLGLMTDNPDPNARRLDKLLTDFFELIYQYDVQPSLWKYFETPGFKRLLQIYDDVTDITINYIDKAMKKYEAEGNSEAKSVLEKLCRVDKRIAIVMAMDMLLAGIDTTSSAFVTLLYLLAKNPVKQENLRQEIRTIMPSKNTTLTEENTKNMPYLRACIKEALRITPITPGNFRITAKDLILSGYKIPQGTGVLMNVMALANTDEYFPRSGEFLPERWLKSSATACPAAKASNPFVYLPFGHGPRTCIGKRIAEMEIETLLAKIIRNYHVTWEGTENLRYISNLILTPAGNVHFKFTPVE